MSTQYYSVRREFETIKEVKSDQNSGIFQIVMADGSACEISYNSFKARRVWIDAFTSTIMVADVFHNSIETDPNCRIFQACGMSSQVINEFGDVMTVAEVIAGRRVSAFDTRKIVDYSD